MNSESSNLSEIECPVCMKSFGENIIHSHVNKCLFFNEMGDTSPKGKRTNRMDGFFQETPQAKRAKNNNNKPKKHMTIEEIERSIILSDYSSSDSNASSKQAVSEDKIIMCEKPKPNIDAACVKPIVEPTVDISIPLAEKMRPSIIEDYIGQEHVIGMNTALRSLFDNSNLPSMILWGPPGVGKTTLAHIIANHCRGSQNTRFVKLSATMSGVNDVKEAVKVAKNDQKFKRKTIMFMDEIHRFNKLQQDIFLPHVESGTITLIGATTENPSFSLNSALLSRCRVIVLEKLGLDNMVKILKRALPELKTVLVENGNEMPDVSKIDFKPKMVIRIETLNWLAGICDGDARIGLNSLQMALNSMAAKKKNNDRIEIVSLDDIKEGVKRSHILYDRKGDQHYDLISALHKSIRASDDNAALYWLTRMITAGEDPKYIVRRLIRMASEDIGLADPQALTVATSTLAAVQHVGMPESDCIIAQCAVYLARAPKSREVYEAFGKCKHEIENCVGSLPPVPLHLRNAPTKLMQNLNYGVGYNLLQKDESGLEYMPEGMEDVVYFSE